MRHGNLTIHGVTSVEMKPINCHDGHYWRDIVLRCDDDYFTVSAFGASHADLQTSEEKSEVRLRAGEYADYLEKGDPLGFERGYVPNGDCPQETEAYNRWLASRPVPIGFAAAPVEFY